MESVAKKNKKSKLKKLIKKKLRKHAEILFKNFN